MKEHNKNPFVGIAKFLISLGLAMLIAKLDLLQLGSLTEYYRWEMILVFFGVWSLVSLEFVSSVILFAVGIYFLMPDMHTQLAPVYKQIYWPVVMVLAGVAFMLRPLVKRFR